METKNSRETGLNWNEVFDLAIQMEKTGAEFYAEAAVNVREEKIQPFMDALARMEILHQEKFENLKAKYAKSDEVEPEKIEPALHRYLAGWLDQQVFRSKQNLEAFFKETWSLEDVAWKAIGMEKDSIAFYYGLKEAAADREVREIINGIMQEELTHVTALGKFLRMIRSQGDSLEPDDLLSLI